MDYHGKDSVRKEKRLTPKECLQKMGIAQTVENFLGTETINGMMHESFVAGCEEVGHKIERMPASLHEKLKSDQEWFEQNQEPGFPDFATEFFMTALVRMIEFGSIYLSESAKLKVIEAWKEDLKNDADGVMEILKATIDYAANVKMNEFVNTWLLYLPMVNSDEDVEAILNVIHGERMTAFEKLLAGVASCDMESGAK